MTFDRLAYVDELTRAGIDEPVARAHASALRAALDETVATKADVRELKGDLREVEHAMKSDLREVEHAMKTDLRELEHRVEAKFAALDRKIESSVRDLTIRGAAGFGLVISAMVGLKLLG